LQQYRVAVLDNYATWFGWHAAWFKSQITHGIPETSTVSTNPPKGAATTHENFEPW
jgi:hypothetical protein